MSDGRNGGTIVKTRSRTATKTIAAVAFLMLLGLTAYGFGFVMGGPKKGTALTGTVAATPREKTDGAPTGAGTASASVCNVADSSGGGGGRCYPTCREKGDCVKAGYVTDYAECAAKSVAICGSSKDCVKRVCGEETPDCVSGYCTRPNLALVASQCPAAPSQFLNVRLAVADSCSADSGKCYRSCSADADCLDTSTYDRCATSAAVKSACQVNALVGGIDQACVTEMCGPKPAVETGSCLKDSSGKPSYCKTPLKDIAKRDSCIVKVAINDVTTIDTGERVWISTCSLSKTICRGDEDCKGTTPTATTDHSCELAKGGCYRRCESDIACATGYDKYVACVADPKTIAACAKGDDPSIMEPSCLKSKCGATPVAKDGTCVAATDKVPGHCSSPLLTAKTQAACTPIVALDNQQSTTSGKNVWLGNCSDDATKSCVAAADCAAPAPVVPSSGKWVGVCPADTAIGTADCTSSDQSACKSATVPTGTVANPIK